MVREHIAVVEIGYAAISDEEPAARATLCAKGEHTKRSSGALEERLEVQNASSRHIVPLHTGKEQATSAGRWRKGRVWEGT